MSNKLFDQSKLKSGLIIALICLPRFAFASHALEALAVLEYFFYLIAGGIVALVNFFFCLYNAKAKKTGMRIFTIILLMIQFILMVLCFKGVAVFGGILLLFILIQFYFVAKSARAENTDEESL